MTWRILSTIILILISSSGNKNIKIKMHVKKTELGKLGKYNNLKKMIELKINKTITN